MRGLLLCRRFEETAERESARRWSGLQQKIDVMTGFEY